MNMNVVLVFVAAWTILHVQPGTQAQCPCAANDDDCEIQEMFKALQDWPTDAVKCIAGNLKFDVKRWRIPYKVQAQQIVYINECSETPFAKVLIETSSACGQIRCCAVCYDCYNNWYDVMPEQFEAQTLMKSGPRLFNTYVGPVKMTVWCAPSGETEPVGHQDFAVTLEYSNDCRPAEGD